jgi:nucleoside-diphosphate-sugar epimerase
MRILVTGTEGYLGSLLAPMLLDHGHQVIGVDTGFYKEGWLYNGAHRTPETLVKDLRLLEQGDLEGVDAVVHMAELSNDPAGDLIPEVTYAINHEGSVHLARLAKRAGVPRFVYMSSCSVYGVAAGHDVDETAPVNPQTAYAVCKTLVERDLSAMADDDFSPTSLRNATAFGASPRMRFDIVLNNLAGYAWTVGEIRMTSDGSPWRPLVHALDICTAIGARSTRRARWCTTRPSTSATRATTTRYARSPRSSRMSSRAARCRSATRAPTTARTASTSARSTACCPASRATGTPSAARGS